MKRISFEDKALVDACRELYLKHGGRKHRFIEAEIRAAGWPEFDRRRLYSNTVRGIEYGGWIERFGWKQEVARAAKQAAERDGGRTTFDDWLRADPSGLEWTARHHAFIWEHLQRVSDGTCKRLMIFVPPRHGKSELVTVRYTAWRLVRDQRMNVVIGCYNQKLANRFSRKIRQITTGRVVRSHNRFAVEEWETAAGGSVKAVGVGAGITGFGGDLIIIDDPIKSRAVANSVNLRDKTWDWYKDDIYTRLEPDAAVILIQTRWHDDDLAGRLLKEMDEGGDQWEVVMLPALAEGGSCSPPYEGGVAPASGDGVVLRNATEGQYNNGLADVAVERTTPSARKKREHPPLLRKEGSLAYADPLGRAEGEPLWPERFDRERLLSIKRQLGTWSFAALYQQRPVPEGGTLFKREWFANIVSKAPEGLRWCRGYDLAVSLKNSADFTASFRVALDKRTGTIYIADGFRKRIEFPEQRKFVKERMEKEPDTAHGIELALHGQALLQDLRRDARTAGRVLIGVKVDADKLMRAEAWSSYAEEGKIVLVNGPWVADFIDEACRFTGRGDRHDDQVDAVSIAVQMIRRRDQGLQTFSPERQP